MSATQQNLISLAIILTVIAFIGWIGQKPTPTPTGLVSINSSAQIDIKKPFTAQQVNLYQFAPSGAETIGSITVELAYDPVASEQQQSEEVVAYVRNQAAAAGANGIVVEIFGLRGQVLYFSGSLVKS